MPVSDQTADVNLRELYYYSKLYDLPEYVKQADAAALCDSASHRELPSTMFADVKDRRFPINTKAATWLSWLHFVEKKAELHPKIAGWIEDRLEQFARYHGIEPDVAGLREKHAELHRDGLAQLPDSTFALVWAGENGTKERRYPLRNPKEVQAAATWFEQYRDHFAFPDRQTIATKILDKAAALGAMLGDELDDVLQRQAGRGVYDPQEAAAMLRNRAKAAVTNCSQEMRQGMLKLAEAVESTPQLAMDPATTAELCKTVDMFDRTTKLAGRYDADGLSRPEDVLFRGTLKAAAQFVKDAVELTNGAVFEQDQLGKLTLRDVRDLFGEELAGAVSDGLEVHPEKMATLARTLPRPDADTLERLMAEAGERPRAKQAGTREGLSRAQLQTLARIADAAAS